MALDPNSVSGQADVFNERMAEYFSKMQKYVASSSGTEELPDFAEFVDLFDSSELLRMTTSRAGDAASFENGAAIENVNHIAALKREFNLRSKTKLDYYTDAQADYANESNYYATLKVFWVNMIRGVYEEGKVI